MGGFVTVALYVAGAWISFAAGHPILGWVGVALGVASLWVWGVSYNFAVERSARRIRQMRENLVNQEELSQREANERTDRIPLRANPQAIPDWLSMLHLGLTVVGVVLLIVVIIARWKGR